MSMCWQRGHFKSVAVRYVKYGSFFREGTSAIRIVSPQYAQLTVRNHFPCSTDLIMASV